MIKAVIFDYFGVIATDNYWNDAHIIADANGDSDKLHYLVSEMDDGKIKWQVFCQNVGELLGVPAEEVDRRAQEININKELVAFAHSLKKDGIKVGLLSNASSEYLLPLLKSAHLHTVFDAIVVSSEVGVSKPHSKMYQTALNDLKISSFEAVFVDDMNSNIAGAEAVGIHGIQFFDTTQTIRDISRLLANTNN